MRLLPQRNVLRKLDGIFAIHPTPIALTEHSAASELAEEEGGFDTSRARSRFFLQPRLGEGRWFLGTAGIAGS
jgi:hypothetical protein